MKHWKQEDIDWLIQNYSRVGKIESAKALGKSEASIRQKASRLKLRQNRDSDFFHDWQSRAAKSKVGKKRPEQAKVMIELQAQGRMKMTESGRKRISEATKEYFKTKGHPKGFKGKKHTETAKELMVNATIAAWANPDSKYNQDDFRQAMSDRASIAQSEGKLRNGYSRGSQGRRQDLDNIFFRSSWEANYARYLNFLKAQGQLYKWEFEPDTFWFEKIKRGVRSYLPDFKLWDTKDSKPYYVEVKGWMDDKSKTKIKRMAKYYPDVRLDVVAKKEYTEIKKKLSRLITGWE